MVDEAQTIDLTLGAFLAANKYSDAFVRDHILPMGAAIWSTTAQDMLDYPLAAFVRFFDSHGLLKFVDRPQWRTVDGGSIEYVKHGCIVMGKAWSWNFRQESAPLSMRW